MLGTFEKEYINTKGRKSKRNPPAPVIFALEILPTGAGANSTGSSVISFHPGLRNVCLSKRWLISFRPNDPESQKEFWKDFQGETSKDMVERDSEGLWWGIEKATLGEVAGRPIKFSRFRVAEVWGAAGLSFGFGNASKSYVSPVFAIEAGYSLTRILKPDNGRGMPRRAST